MSKLFCLISYLLIFLSFSFRALGDFALQMTNSLFMVRALLLITNICTLFFSHFKEGWYFFTRLHLILVSAKNIQQTIYKNEIKLSKVNDTDKKCKIRRGSILWRPAQHLPEADALTNSATSWLVVDRVEVSLLLFTFILQLFYYVCL